MKKFFIFLPLMALAACDEPKPSDGAKNMIDHTPVLIAHIDGVKLWKVADGTNGGSQYVYFTSRGDTFEEHSCGKNCRERQSVPGVPNQ
jgi:hypothetical protein